MFDTLSENLRVLGYSFSCFETKEEAAEYLCGSLHGQTIGFGGSVTLQQLDISRKLAEDNTVFWHWEPQPGKNAGEMREAAVSAEVYLSSVNAIAETGEIINIDGTCNRIAGMLYGHKKVILVLGRNKLAPTYDEALFRARNIAAPLNAKRLNRKTPCAVKGDRCYNCSSPERICNALSVLWRKPGGCEYEVLMINEDLGY